MKEACHFATLAVHGGISLKVGHLSAACSLLRELAGCPCVLFRKADLKVFSHPPLESPISLLFYWLIGRGQMYEV